MMDHQPGWPISCRPRRSTLAAQVLSEEGYCLLANYRKGTSSWCCNRSNRMRVVLLVPPPVGGGGGGSVSSRDEGSSTTYHHKRGVRNKSISAPSWELFIVDAELTYMLIRRMEMLRSRRSNAAATSKCSEENEVILNIDSTQSSSKMRLSSHSISCAHPSDNFRGDGEVVFLLSSSSSFTLLHSRASRILRKTCLYPADIVQANMIARL